MPALFMKTLHCLCPHCAEQVEFLESACAQVINCPKCMGRMTLPDKPASHGLWHGIVGTVKAAQRTLSGKGGLRTSLLNLFADGILTDEKIDQVKTLLAKTQLTPQDISAWRIDLFKYAMASVDKEGLSSERLAGLASIQAFLRVEDGEIPGELARLKRWQYLLQLREQGPTAIEVTNIILRPGEQAFWIQPCVVYEAKVVSQRYDSDSRGGSVKALTGTRFMVEAGRGKFISKTADVEVGPGHFIITSQRLVYLGTSQSFETKFEKLAAVERHADGICYRERNNQAKRKIEITDNNSDVFAEILNWAVSHYGNS